MTSTNQDAAVISDEKSAHKDVSRDRMSGWLLRCSFLAAIVIYARTITFDWVFDDYPQIVMNGWLRGWRHIPEFFTRHMWAFAYSKWPGKYYRPGFLLWLWGNFHLFGPTPGWWHAVAVIAHLTASALVYLIARLLTRDRMVAATAAAIFVLHPIHIEAIAWISGATEILVAILVLASFYFYLRTQNSGFSEGSTASKSLIACNNVAIALSVALYALALLAKETAVVLPLLICACEWLKPGRFRQKVESVAKTLWPFAAVTSIYVVARWFALKGFAHPDQVVSVATQLFTLPSLLWFYVHQLVWPWNLALFYDVELILQPGAGNFWLPMLLVTLIAMAGLICVRGRRDLQLALWMIVLPLLPVIVGVGVFQRHDYVHDRYLYLPSVGFVILLAVAIRELSARLAASELGRQRSQALIATLFMIAFCVGIYSQLGQWDSDYSLFIRAAQRAPQNPLPRRYLGETLISLGRPADAIKLYKEALERDPQSWLDAYCLGTTYLRASDWKNAKQYLQFALEHQPTVPVRDPMPTLQLGWAILYGGNPAEAERYFRDAIVLRDDGPGFHRALALALQHQNKLQESRVEFRRDDVIQASDLAAQDSDLGK